MYIVEYPLADVLYGDPGRVTQRDVSTPALLNVVLVPFMLSVFE